MEENQIRSALKCLFTRNSDSSRQRITLAKTALPGKLPPRCGRIDISAARKMTRRTAKRDISYTNPAYAPHQRQIGGIARTSRFRIT